MDTGQFAAALASAKDSATFVGICQEQSDASDHVSLEIGAVAPLAETVRQHQPSGWDWFLGDPNEDMRHVVANFCLGSSLNGGYFFRDPSGQTAQWQRNGSGSTALVDWLASVRSRDVTPGIGLTSPHDVAEQLGVELAQQPLARKRLAICTEAADQGRLSDLVSLVSGTQVVLPSGTHGRRFSFSDVLGLVDLYPEGFGEDPFRKKAILFFLLLSGHFAARGVPVENDLAIPSDYQMARGFAWAGVISVSGGSASLLRSDRLIDVRSGEIMDYRAAAVAAARQVGMAADREDWVVDGALFGRWRKDPSFKTDSLSPAKCDSIWF